MYTKYKIERICGGFFVVGTGEYEENSVDDSSFKPDGEYYSAVSKEIRYWCSTPGTAYVPIRRDRFLLWAKDTIYSIYDLDEIEITSKTASVILMDDASENIDASENEPEKPPVDANQWKNSSPYNRKSCWRRDFGCSSLFVTKTVRLEMTF